MTYRTTHEHVRNNGAALGVIEGFQSRKQPLSPKFNLNELIDEQSNLSVMSRHQSCHEEHQDARSSRVSTSEGEVYLVVGDEGLVNKLLCIRGSIQVRLNTAGQLQQLLKLLGSDLDVQLLNHVVLLQPSTPMNSLILKSRRRRMTLPGRSKLLDRKWS